MNVFALDRVADAFIGRAAPANGNGHGNGNGHEPAVVDTVDVVDVVAAEAEEQAALATTPVPVAERIPVVAHGEDTLPVGSAVPVVPRAPVVPRTNPFPLRDPDALDQRALRRLKELWRTTNNRRRPNGRY
jgi:hypothetical protein